MPPPPPPELVARVARYRASHTESELELRLGVHGEGHFRAGVPRDVFEQLERDLLDANLEADRHWSELVDYHYATARGERARTRVTFDAERMEVRSEHVCKRARESLVLRTRDDDGACRVAWSSEVPLADPPEACVPTHVRVQQRRRFRDLRGGRVVWSYDLSKTWSGGSRGAVEELQRVSEPTYEVECELVDEGGAYLGARSDEAVAASLLFKARGLLGDDGEALEVADEKVERTDSAPRKRARRTTTPRVAATSESSTRHRRP